MSKDDLRECDLREAFVFERRDVFEGQRGGMR